jgi:asparaginyl-tRNA synthetase
LETHHKTLLNSSWYKLIATLQDEINYATTIFYRKKGIRSIYLPLISNSISSPISPGSDSKPEKITIRGINTYLSDSLQFLLELGTRIHKKGAYYIMPSFRGDTVDARHLNQFYHSEVEIPGHLPDIKKLAEEYIFFLAKHILDNHGEMLEASIGDISHIEKAINHKNGIQSIRYEEARILLKNQERYFKKNPFQFPVITPRGEKKLIDHFDGIVWLTHYPQILSPFYQKPEEGSEFALTADLLFGIGETLGAGERHRFANELKKSIKMQKVCENDYEWYIEMKRISPEQTSGFGMGIERFLLWLTKTSDIRDCQIIPQYYGININP